MVMVIGSSTTVDTRSRAPTSTPSAGSPRRRVRARASARGSLLTPLRAGLCRLHPASSPGTCSTSGPAARGCGRSCRSRGANLIRRWERRFALTTELLVRKATRGHRARHPALYDAPLPATAVVLSGGRPGCRASRTTRLLERTGEPPMCGDDPALRGLHRLQPLACRPGNRLQRDRRQPRRGRCQPAGAGGWTARPRRGRCSSSRSSLGPGRSAS